MKAKRKKEGYVLYSNGPAMEEMKRIVKDLKKNKVSFNESLMVVDYSDGSKDYVLTISENKFH